jgi:dihydroorotate dehydrogenase (fumarate)
MAGMGAHPVASGDGVRSACSTSPRRIDLTTTYLRLKLRNPLVASASPHDTRTSATVRPHRRRTARPRPWSCRLSSRSRSTAEGNEQVDRSHFRRRRRVYRAESAVAIPRHPIELPDRGTHENYLEHIRQGQGSAVEDSGDRQPERRHFSGRLDRSYARRSRAGRRRCAIELNVSITSRPTPKLTGERGRAPLSATCCAQVKSAVPYPRGRSSWARISAPPANMAKRELDAAGADGLVLFNRFYQPDYRSRSPGSRA